MIIKMPELELNVSFSLIHSFTSHLADGQALQVSFYIGIFEIPKFMASFSLFLMKAGYQLFEVGDVL